MSVQDQPQSPSPRHASAHEVAGFGVAMSIAGLYFMLGAYGLLPMPETNGPAFIVFAAGAAFLFAGLVCFFKAGTGMADAQTEVPDGAPAWIRLSYRMLAIGIFGAFATIGTWIAIGSGPRVFTVSSSIGEMQAGGDALGRTIFGLGAVIVWICVIALTIGTVRKLFNRSGG
jgi:hypothetical protein